MHNLHVTLKEFVKNFKRQNKIHRFTVSQNLQRSNSQTESQKQKRIFFFFFSGVTVVCCQLVMHLFKIFPSFLSSSFFLPIGSLKTINFQKGPRPAHLSRGFTVRAAGFQETSAKATAMAVQPGDVVDSLISVMFRYFMG